MRIRTIFEQSTHLISIILATFFAQLSPALWVLALDDFPVETFSTGHLTAPIASFDIVCDFVTILAKFIAFISLLMNEIK